MELRNIHSYKNFLNKAEIENIDEELIDYTEYGNLNEGLFSFLGNMFKNLKQFLNKIKGGEKVQNLYMDYLKVVNDRIKNTFEIDMKLPEVNSNFDQLISKPKPGEEKKEEGQSVEGEKEGEGKEGEGKEEGKPEKESFGKKIGNKIVDKAMNSNVGKKVINKIASKMGEKTQEGRLYLSYYDFINEAVEEDVQDTETTQEGQGQGQEGQGQSDPQEGFKTQSEVLKKNRPKIANMMKLEWKKNIEKNVRCSKINRWRRKKH